MKINNILIGVGISLFIIVILYTFYIIQVEEKESLEKTGYSLDDKECGLACEYFNYKFFRYELGGIGRSPNCWCIKEDLPIQIY